jgi:hypothetical protein
VTETSLVNSAIDILDGEELYAMVVKRCGSRWGKNPDVRTAGHGEISATLGTNYVGSPSYLQEMVMSIYPERGVQSSPINHGEPDARKKALLRAMLKGVWRE